MRKGMQLVWMLWLAAQVHGQDTCFRVPVKLINAISNPTFENPSVPCTSGYNVVPGWVVPTNEVPVAFLNACTKFEIPDTTIFNESIVLPNVCMYPIVPLPIPSGTGVAAVSDYGYTGAYYLYPFHKSYVATCLNSPLVKDTLYRLSFYVGFGQKGSHVVQASNGYYLGPEVSLSKEEFGVFGTPDCSTLNASQPIIGCPARTGWIPLGTVRVEGQPGSWVSTSIQFTPGQDIQAIALGPSCDTVYAVPDSFYYKGMELECINYSYFLNDLQLLEASVPAPVVSISSGTPCSSTFTLQMQPAAFYAGSAIQWFRNDSLISSASSSTLNVNSGPQTAGWYFCKVQNDTVCLNSDSVYLTWLATPSASMLGAADTLACDGDSIVLKPSSDTSFQYSWQDGSQKPYFVVTKPGNYSVTMTNQCGTAVAQKSVTYEKCNYAVIVPNAFTPNGDGHNDVFRVRYYYPPAHFDMSVYNRFGMKIFSSSDPSQGWDGTLHGVAQPLDTYAWTIQYMDHEGTQHFLKGTVVLVR
jgi:gliding motility-associated-like protein